MYIHTRGDLVLELRPQTRPPKSYSRFRDLVRKLLVERPESGLIMVYAANLSELLDRIKPGLVIGLSTQGKMTSIETLAAEISRAKNPAVILGGFPKGHFTPETTGRLDEIVRIHRDSLDAHVVAARLVYEIERVCDAPRT